MSKKNTQTFIFQIENELKEELKYLSKKQGISLHIILLAAFKILLFRRNGQFDLSVASPNATFSDILKVKTSLTADEPVDAFLQRLKGIVFDAFLYANGSSIKIGDGRTLKNGADPSTSFLFVFQNYAEEELNRDKFEEAGSNFELTLSLTETSDYLQGLIVYSHEIYNDELIRRIIGHYKELLYSISRQQHQRIGELPMITQEEHQLLIDFNNTRIEYPENQTIVNLFESQAKNTPDHIALVYNEVELSYAELNAKSNQFAHFLKLKGVKAETLIPVCLGRSVEMIVALLGVLKAGGVCVPVDPEIPEDRLKFILKDTNARLLIGTKEIRKRLIAERVSIEVIALDNDLIITEFPDEDIIGKPAPEDLAYVFYTSGSTGKPKGVMIEHKSIFNYILDSREKFISAKKDGAGTFVHLSYTFDASLKSIFTPLVSGKSIIISSKPLAYVFEDPNLFKYAPYDFIQLTPSHLDFFYLVYKDEHGKLITNKLSIGGDALYLTHFEQLIDSGDSLDIVNEYGPTEATVACSSYSFDLLGKQKLRQRLPVGKPIANTNIFILNEYDQPVPVGVIGEICIGGVQVARGYLNNPELTRKKFIPNPYTQFTGERLYKTGDTGRWLPDGNFECLGRKDDQVKIRGYRIELGEIESVLIQHDMVKQVSVVTKEDIEHNRRFLVAHLVPNGIFDKKELVSYLQTRLPGYMIPESWIIQQSLPISPNGKIDKNVLPESQAGFGFDDPAIEKNDAPQTKEEQVIAEIWKDVLGVEQIGVKDNFFELGEPSLLAIKVLRLVEEITGKYLPLSTIYEHPTIEKFVKHLKENQK